VAGTKFSIVIIAQNGDPFAKDPEARIYEDNEKDDQELLQRIKSLGKSGTLAVRTMKMSSGNLEKLKVDHTTEMETLRSGLGIAYRDIVGSCSCRPNCSPCGHCEARDEIRKVFGGETNLLMALRKTLLRKKP